MTLDEAVAYALEGGPIDVERPVIFDAASRPQPILILDGDDERAAGGRDPRRPRPGGRDADVRELRCPDGRAQVQAHLPLRVLPVLLRLLLSGRGARDPARQAALG